jgi:hypothetical protein
MSPVFSGVLFDLERILGVLPDHPRQSDILTAGSLAGTGLAPDCGIQDEEATRNTNRLIWFRLSASRTHLRGEHLCLFKGQRASALYKKVD